MLKLKSIQSIFLSAIVACLLWSLINGGWNNKGGGDFPNINRRGRGEGAGVVGGMENFAPYLKRETKRRNE